MTVEEPAGGYGVLAGEYYDARRHPTCANFREGSLMLIARALSPLLPCQVLEVGAGLSVVAEILQGSEMSLEDLWLTDASKGMLAHSRAYATEGAVLKVADARRLPFPDQSFDALVSSLGDPYNDDTFWSEVGRVLRPGGHVLFTTPSWEWSQRFRAMDGSGQSIARFETAESMSIDVPSHVLPVASQCDMMSKAGFERLDLLSVTAGELANANVSTKLGVEAELGVPVVRGYVGVRRGDKP